ncbi:MAG: O-antigen ligase family protein [Oscillospiraceae bacterium]|nr:O-antigen ligase family protein [Oscillospiraceae bacterium]
MKSTLSISQIILFLFLTLYPILPDYCRFASVPSYSLLVILLSGLWVLFDGTRFKLAREFFGVFILYFSIEILCMVLHSEVITLFRFVVEQMLVLFILTNTLRKFDFNYCLRLIVVTSGIVAFSGVLEYIFEFNIWSLIENYSYSTASLGSIEYFRLGSIRIEQSFNHAISYAAYIMLSVFLCIYVIKTNSKFIYKAILCVLLLNLLLTKTRSVLLITAFGILLIYLINKEHKVRTRKQVLLGGVIVSGAILAFIIALICSKGIRSSFQQYFYMLAGLFSSDYRSMVGGIDNPFTYRFSLFTEIWNNLKHNRVFGIGVNATDNMKIAFFNTQYNVTLYNNSIDNTYLRELSKYGVFGLSSYILMYGYFLVSGGKHMKAKKNDLFYKYFFIIVLTYMIVLFTFPQMQEYRLFFVIISMFIVYRDEHDETNTQVNKVGALQA